MYYYRILFQLIISEKVNVLNYILIGYSILRFAQLLFFFLQIYSQEEQRAFIIENYV